MNAFPVILSAPSGAGKTTIARELLRRRRDVGYSTSATTRARREGEEDGADYHFLTREAFARRRDAGEFAEWAEVHGEWYGTLRAAVDGVLAEGRHVVMDIDVEGARQFARAYPESVLVFVIPPTVDVLLERLRARGSETPATLQRRLRTAQREIEAVGEYHYVVINDVLSAAVDRVSSVIDAELARCARPDVVHDAVARFADDLRRAVTANV